MAALLSDPRAWWYAAEWAIRLGALAVVPLRRQPAAAASWLLLLFFLPGPGLLLFLAIGRPRFPRWRARRWAELRPFLGQVAGRLAAEGCPEGPAAAFAATLGRLPAVGGNRLELLDDYDGVVARLVADIDAARDRVDLLVYIFADDAVGGAVAAALGRARERGVRCRVMFDPVGSWRWRRGTRRLLARHRVEVRESLPLRLRHRSRRDMRNHRKLWVVDGRVGYAGSQNLVAKDFRPGVTNRELVARIEGPAVAALAAIVHVDWAIERGGEAADPVDVPAAAAGGSCLQLLPSGADFPLEGFETLLVWLLHRACRHAVLVTPYFVPDEQVLGAMRAAATRGVAVDLVVSAAVDQRVVHLAQSSYLQALMDAGVRVHAYRGYLLHAKNVAVDGTLGIVGSANVDLRSFQLNEEASLLLHDPADVARLDAVQAGYLAASDPVDPAAWARRPRWRRLAENVARLMSPLL